MRLWRGWEITGSLVPRPSVTANVVEGLVNSYIECQVDVQKRGLSHHACTSIAVYQSATPPNVHLMSFYVQCVSCD